MRNKLKYTALLLALLLLITGTAMVATAADGADAGGEDSGYDSGDGGEYVEPDPVIDDGGEYVEPDPVIDDGGEYVEPDPVVDDGGGEYVEPDYGSDTVYYNYIDDSPISYGGDYDSSNDIDAGSVSDYANLYNTGTLNDADVAANTWSDIVISENAKNADVGSFSAIKSDTATEDNSQWIMYAGIALIGLAVLGILYFIIATVTARKRQKKAPTRATAAVSYTPSRSSKPAHRYSDGYESYAEQRQKRSARIDTTEINIPL